MTGGERVLTVAGLTLTGGLFYAVASVGLNVLGVLHLPGSDYLALLLAALLQGAPSGIG